MPWLSIKVPIKLVSPNRQEHWATKAKRNRKQRELLGYLLNTLERPPYFPVQICLTRIGPRPFDSDNLVTSFKNLRDILSDWLIPNLAAGRADGDPRLVWKYDQQKGEVREHAVLITITTTETTNQEF